MGRHHLSRRNPLVLTQAIRGYNINMEKTRSGAQDIAKGLMIIAVVFFHCYIETFENHGDSIKDFNILVACFPFILSTFFFYAGYNYTPNGRTYKENILRRAKQLLIPFAVAFLISTVLISCMELAFHHDDPSATFHAIGNSVLYGLMSEPMALMIGFPQEGGIIFELILALCLLWFLYALFFCSLLFYWLVKYTNKKRSTLISVVVALLIIAFCIGQFVGTYLPYQVESYPVILAIMLVAAYLRKSNFLDRPVEGKKGVVFLILNALLAEGLIIGASFVLNACFGTTTAGSLPSGLFDPAIRGFDAFVAFAFGLLGIYFVHTLSRGIARVPILGTCLQWLGKRSAIFYLFHPIFLELAAIAIFQKKIPWGRGQAFFYVAVVLAALTLTCLLIEWIAKKIRSKKKESEAGVSDGQ